MVHGQALVLIISESTYKERHGCYLYRETGLVPELLGKWADKYGFAMVNTRGKLVEYAKDLMNAVTGDGGHAVIMTDHDNSGIKIASESPTEIPWLGANDKMFRSLKIPREKVSVPKVSDFSFEYVKYLAKHGVHPSGREYKRSGEEDGRFKEIDIRFLARERVELDAILAEVGDERVFNYIKDCLEDLISNKRLHKGYRHKRRPS